MTEYVGCFRWVAAWPLALLVVVVLAFAAGRCSGPGETVRVVPVVEEAGLPDVEVVFNDDAPVPVEVTRWRDRPVVRWRECPVPEPLVSTGFVLSSPEPLTIGPRRVTWTYFDVDSLRYERRTYEVPEARWWWTGAVEVGDDVLVPGPQAVVRLPVQAGYRRVYAWGAPAVQVDGAGVARVTGEVGVGLRLW